MQNAEVVSVGTVSDGGCLIEFKSWLEGARDMLIPAIQRADDELQQIRRIESEFSGTESLSCDMEGLTGIRTGMEEWLEILRDQDREWIQRINSVEDLKKISAAWEASGGVFEGCCLIELKTWLEGARDKLIRAIQRAENELQRTRRIESELYKTQPLSPFTERLIAIRTGMEECLVILHDLNVEWIGRIAWVENPVKITATWEVFTESLGVENLFEIKPAAPSKELISGLAVAPFRYEEQAQLDRKNSRPAAPSKSLFERHPLPFLLFILAAVLITGSLGYLIANQSNQIADLHKHILTLNNKLSTSYSINRKLTLKNANLNYYMTNMQAQSNDLKDKNNELQIALQAASSSLAQSKHDLGVMKTTNRKMISNVKSNLMAFASTQAKLQGLRYLSQIYRSRLSSSLILSPEWFSSGESYQIMKPRLTMLIQQAVNQNSGSDVIVQLSSGLSETARHPFDKTFQPRLGIPENFRFNYKRFSLVLLGTKANNDGTKGYLIAILKK